MSEYTYACPVCGQHMRCDSSQAGTVMECPTCFQKIIAPQAPAPGADQKFVLTGTKVGDRPTTKITETNPGMVPVKSFPGAIFVMLLLVGLAGAGVFLFRGMLFKTAGENAGQASSDNGRRSKNQKPEKPAVIAPPASDANWTLSPGTNAIPDSPVVGRIHGQNFIVERAYFQNGILTLRQGTRGPLEFGCTINFGGAMSEALSGQTINITTNADTAARVTLRWKNDTGSGKDNFDSDYAMRLEFGTLANNRLPGKIYLCTPDEEKSYLVGTFNADARKPKPKAQKK